MHDIYIFYATTVNIHVGVYTPYNVMIYNNETFYLPFLNAMLMQTSKYAKVKRIHAMLKSKYE